MCIFRGPNTRVRGLLKGVNDFPIPLLDEFGGEVVLGWKTWGVRDGFLVSAIMRTPWNPGTPLRATEYFRSPQYSGGNDLGIFAYAEKEKVSGPFNIWGQVAIWGKVFDYDKRAPFGVIGEFAYPLEIHISKGASTATADAKNIAKRWGPMGVDVFFGEEQIA